MIDTEKENAKQNVLEKRKEIVKTERNLGVGKCMKKLEKKKMLQPNPTQPTNSNHIHMNGLCIIMT